MNLTVDIGNTKIKYAIFSEKEIVEFQILEKVGKADFAKITKDFPIKRTIVSSVLKHAPEFLNYLKERTNFFEYTAETPTPLKNLYATINTLGSDRLTAAVGAWVENKNEDLLVIDFGTCIKYNFISAKAEFLGGGISPGLLMRFKSLNQFTDRLPIVDFEEDYEKLIGSSTRESILSGVIIGLVAEVDGIINKYKEQYPELKCVITGGDARFFEKRLKNSIFVDQFLVLKGLNEILNFNVKEK